MSLRLSLFIFVGIFSTPPALAPSHISPGPHDGKTTRLGSLKKKKKEGPADNPPALEAALFIFFHAIPQNHNGE
jgi:hypothetical protein